jgi:hypothetical protein
MSTFKQKTNKKITVAKQYFTTLDCEHTKIINEFENDNVELIPSLKKERKKCKKQLELLMSNGDNDIEPIMELKDRIDEITKNINNLKKKKNDYYLDNSKLIFEYFEYKKNINNTDNATANVSQTSEKSKALFSIFKIRPKESDANATEEMKTQNLVQKYMSNIDDSFIDMNLYLKNMDVCGFCNSGSMVALDDEGVLVCDSCSAQVPFLVENEKPSYKEPPKEVCFYSYKKITHFKEIIAQHQGKETTQIPDDHITQIELQIKKERITTSELTYKKMKEILKKLGLSRYYEHIAFIKNRIGISPPVFSQQLEEILCNLFMEILVPYAKVCPNDRINFLNYHFVLYKLLELLGEDKYLNDIPMLKDRLKLVEQDYIWRQICDINDWEAIPTV